MSWERNNITVMLIHISGNFNWNFQAVTVKQYFDKGSILALPREGILTIKVYWMKYGLMVRNRIYTIWILVKEGKANFRIRGSDHVIHNLILGNLWLLPCDQSNKTVITKFNRFISSIKWSLRNNHRVSMITFDIACGILNWIWVIVISSIGDYNLSLLLFISFCINPVKTLRQRN